MTEQHTYCAALDCTRRGEHLRTCTGITTCRTCGPRHGEHLPACDGSATCKGCWPRTADRGYLCQRHYDRINNALRVADQLRTALAAVERAVKADADGSTVAGPRLPLTGWQMDLDRIERAVADKTTEDPKTGAQTIVRFGYRGDLDAWVNTFQGALDALDFAHYVHLAERSHPLVDRTRELKVVRCGGCLQRTVLLKPPHWYTGYRTLKCTECGWKTTDEDHAEAGAYVEALVRDPYPRPKITIPDGPIDLAQFEALARALR